MVCPLCEKKLDRAGVLIVDDETFTVFQCSSCTRMMQLDETLSVPVAMTFAVSSTNNIYDAQTLSLLESNHAPKA